MGRRTLRPLETSSTTRTTRTTEIDLGRLEREARASEAGEAYRCVSRDANHRLGIATTVGQDGTTAFSLELLVRVVSDQAVDQVPLLTAALHLSRRLRSRGYAPAHPGDSWMSWEKVVPRGRVAAECATLRALVVRELGRVGEIEPSSSEGKGD